MESNKLQLLKTQIEYYLSDENLKRDKFFHEKITNDTDGYLDVDLILMCNKIKNSGAVKEDIINAIKQSSELELQGERVRRAGNKPLPELKLLNKKSKRSEDEDEDKERDNEEEQSFDPIILLIKSDKEPDFKWKAIQDKFKELNPKLRVAYLRFKEGQGHIGVFNSSPELSFSESFEIDGVKFEVKKCEGDELIDFWKDHGSHFELCIGRNGKFDKKGKKFDRKKKDINFIRNPITLGDESYTDVLKIKSRARKILTSTKDGEKIASPDHEFLLDLIKNHRNFEQKSQDLSYFTTGKPTENNYTRCFFIVKNDDKKEDFSIHKCVERIANDSKKKNK